MPILTVLLVVRNCEAYIKDCINSILSQTFPDFELLIIDDGSCDRTSEIIQSYSDQRIRFIQQEYTQYISSLNKGLAMAAGKYIARMDGDDIMHLNRLELQIQALDNYPEAALCHTAAECFGVSSRTISCYSGLLKEPLLAMMRYNIVAHPSVMLRSSFLRKYNLKYEPYPYAEDYKLWAEMAKCGASFVGIDTALLRYRCSPSQVSVQKQEEQAETSFKIQQEILQEVTAKYQLEELYHNLLQYNYNDELSASSIINTIQEIATARARNIKF